MRELGVGTCQIPTVPGDIGKNLEMLEQSIEAIKVSSPWVRLVCAHELCIQGTPDMEGMAQQIPGDIIESCARIARRKEIYLIPGSLYERKDGRIYNTAPVIDPQGKLIALYRKLYPWLPGEKTTPGDNTLVFDIPEVGRLGLCICYDLWFPEVIRDLVWKGSEAVFIPTSTSTPDRSQELVLTQASAIANQCYVVSVNGTGRGGIGQSLIVDPEGTIVQQTGQEPENMAAKLDFAHVRNVREKGTCGVSRPLASYFHEQHRFDHQKRNYAESPLWGLRKIL
ncbi:MAG TPA: carbon-nitrogen hydrolase family protein [Desulfomonilia bacterium]|nr:carbon-nitrogen hydrolase family protein [Desulfomonilia bacterium]